LREAIPAERSEFAALMHVSRETMLRLDRYASLLIAWNEKFNLVAESTIPHIWKRHFLDSAQLVKHIPKGVKTIGDIGSGAGFPGLVLSILGIPNIHLIEATGKKVTFLRAVIADLNLSTEIVHERAESLRDSRYDVVTARAVGSVLDLLNYARHLIHKDSLCLFLKGQNADAELTEASKYWTFTRKKIQSLSDNSGSILVLKDITQKNVAPRKKRPKRDE
jgi:16S rRNA (guanine527-N7)-methyltransferase